MKSKMNLKYYLKLFKRFSIIEFKKINQYKANFLLLVISILGEIFLFIVFWKIIFLHTNSLNGWNFNDLLLLLFYNYFFWLFAEVLGRSITLSFYKIINGNFDLFLIYPFNPIFVILFSKIEYTYIISELIIIVLLFIYLIKFYPINLILSGLLLSLIGIVVFYELLFIMNCLTFFTEKNRFRGILYYLVELTGKYPLNITSKWIKIILTYVVPLMFISTFSVLYIKGILNFWYIFIRELALLIIFYLIARFLWFKGLKNYQSAFG